MLLIVHTSKNAWTGGDISRLLMVLKNGTEMFHVLEVKINIHPACVCMEVSQCGSCWRGVRYFFCIGSISMDPSHNLLNLDKWKQILLSLMYILSFLLNWKLPLLSNLLNWTYLPQHLSLITKVVFCENLFKRDSLTLGYPVCFIFSRDFSILAWTPLVSAFFHNAWPSPWLMVYHWLVLQKNMTAFHSAACWT